MIVKTVKQYNEEEMIKWQENVDEWSKENHPHNIIPQVVFYGFRRQTGELKKVGFVASIGKAHYWAKTKKEVIKRALKG